MRAVTSGKSCGEQRLKPRLHPVAGFEVLRDDDNLRHEVVVELHVERQVEADGAAADIGGETGDVGVARERLLQPLRLRLGCRDRGVLRQGHRHQEFRPVRSREELLLHEAQAIDGSAESDERGGDGEPGMPHAGAEHPAESAHEAAGLSRVMRLHARGQHDEPDHRGEDDGHEPGGDERHGDDGEEREGVLPGVVVGEADRQEAEDGDQRAGQHGEGGGGIGEGRRLHFLHALLDLRDHHLDGDHGIVDQKAEGDDERAERDALQADVHGLHAHEDDGEHERDGQGNDDPSPQPEAQEAHHEDDGDRLEERLGEAAESLLHDLRLVRDEVELDPDGQALHQASSRFVEALAEGEIVAARAPC